MICLLCIIFPSSRVVFAQYSTPQYLVKFPYDTRVRHYPSSYSNQISSMVGDFDSTDVNMTINSNWSLTSTRLYYVRVSGTEGRRFENSYGWVKLYSSASGGTLCTFVSGGNHYLDPSKCNREEKVAYAYISINEHTMMQDIFWNIDEERVKQRVVSHETAHVFFGIPHISGCEISIMNTWSDTCWPPEMLTETDKQFLNLHY